MSKLFLKTVETIYSILCVVYVWMLIHYSVAMWETRQRYGIIFLTLSLMIASLQIIKGRGSSGLKDTVSRALACLFFVLILGGGIYFWTEYGELVHERAGFTNQTDTIVSAVYIYIVIHLTWATTGRIIPLVVIVFAAYGLFGHWAPGFLFHPKIPFSRFMELSAGEIDGIFGPLNQLSATWIAIFAFFAGFVQGYGGLDYILRISYHFVGHKKTRMPQVAVISSMAFGCMSGSAAANAAGTGSFTIPTMKRFGLPPAIAASIETIASSGGQIMPPILGASAFVMCDYLGLYYYQILLASIFASVIFFGSTMLSVHFIAERYIDPEKEVEIPPALKEKMDLPYIFQGVPILIAFIVLLLVFIVYRVNILIGGVYSLMSFLATRFLYDLVVNKVRPVFIWTFLKNLYHGTLRGASFMASMGAMMAALGIVIRVLTTTGLGEKISYSMVSTFGGTMWLLLVLTMVICIIFGMAVSTVAAYILVVTLSAPALVKFGIEPLVAHFAVFYWAMLSAFTPPVAGICVVTSGIARASFLHTCWESMKLGLPKFILPFYFIRYPELLSFGSTGFLAFFIASVGFIALSAGIQSGWGLWQQTTLFMLGTAILLSPAGILDWICIGITLVVFPILWKQHSAQSRAVGPQV